jgi:hypothetical protein
MDISVNRQRVAEELFGSLHHRSKASLLVVRMTHAVLVFAGAGREPPRGYDPILPSKSQSVEMPLDAQAPSDDLRNLCDVRHKNALPYQP